MRSRSAGLEHSTALESVVRSYTGLSLEKKERVWRRFQQRESIDVDPCSKDRDLAVLVFSMIYEAKGPFDDKITSWVTEQIREVTFKLEEQHRFSWD